METPLASMTGFARAQGEAEGARWVWEVRSVNGRGLELRFRLPPGFDAIEPGLREAATPLLRRGNVNATLTVQRDQAAARGAPDPAALDTMLRLATELQARIPGAPPIRAEFLLALPGVLRSTPTETPDDVPSAILTAATGGFATALAALVTARQAEGTRLAIVLGELLGDVAALHAQATSEASDQPALQRARLAETLKKLLEGVAGLPPDERLAQEVALLAARSDVREELDRLAGHIEAARALLAEGAAIGRRFDFLTQEFNREVNTLCSKSASPALTTTGLRLKATVEQMREQVQNVE